MESSVPQIVVTEPSPMPVVNTTITEKVRIADDTATIIQTTAPLPTLTSTSVDEVVLDPKSPRISEEVSDDAKSPRILEEVSDAKSPRILEEVSDAKSEPVSDSEACSLAIEEKVQDVTMELDETTRTELTPGDEQITDDHFRNTPTEEGFYNLFHYWLYNFSESKFMLPVLLMLLAVPISAGFMGARYFNECPMSSVTPLFVFMMGFVGTVVILCRMFFIVQKTSLSNCGEWKLLNIVIVFGNLSIILLFFTEMVTFFRVTPNFADGTLNYCHPIFYHYTYWMNWGCLFLAVFLSVMHAPKFFSQPPPAESLSSMFRA